MLASLTSPEFNWADIKVLGEQGLDPATYRSSSFVEAKKFFRKRLLPENPQDPGFGRTLTALLLLETMKLQQHLSVWEIRDLWYTGKTATGEELKVKALMLREHLQRWSYFMARQHQRYAIELFLWCFENALKDGCRSIDEAVDHWIGKTTQEGLPLEDNFEKLMKRAAGAIWTGDDSATSKAWNAEIHRDHDLFEYVHEPQGDSALYHALTMVAGWYWRMVARENESGTEKFMRMGGSDRMGMAWFLNWLRSRRPLPIRDFIREIFSDLIFSQHMRIALSRFDGKSQRLRFLLGDRGILLHYC